MDEHTLILEWTDMSDPKRWEMLRWCRENFDDCWDCKPDYSTDRVMDRWIFASEADVVLFKMRWL